MDIFSEKILGLLGFCISIFSGIVGYVLKEFKDRYSAGVKTGRHSESFRVIKRSVDNLHNRVAELELLFSKQEASVRFCQTHNAEHIRELQDALAKQNDDLVKRILEGVRELL